MRTNLISQNSNLGFILVGLADVSTPLGFLAQFYIW